MLVWRAEKESGAWIRALSGLHLTYLALDAWHRLDSDVPPLLAAMPSAGETWAVEWRKT